MVCPLKMQKSYEGTLAELNNIPDGEEKDFEKSFRQKVTLIQTLKILWKAWLISTQKCYKEYFVRWKYNCRSYRASNILARIEINQTTESLNSLQLKREKYRGNIDSLLILYFPDIDVELQKKIF